MNHRKTLQVDVWVLRGKQGTEEVPKTFCKKHAIFLKDLIPEASILNNTVKSSHDRFLLTHNCVPFNKTLSFPKVIQTWLCAFAPQGVELYIGCKASTQDFNQDRHTGCKAGLNSERGTIHLCKQQYTLLHS